MFQLPVTKNRGKIVKVSDITYCLPNERARAYQSNLMNIKRRFAQDVPLQSNFIFLVHNCTYIQQSDCFSYEQEGINKSTKALRHIHHFQRTSGPRIVFLVKAHIQGNWQNYLLYSHPIVSIQYPVLIDSSLERDFVLCYL